LDAGYPDERLRYVVDDAAIRVLLTQRNQHERAARLGVERVLCLDSRDAEQVSEENPISSVSGENLCYVIYTSGSTGGPKGVMVTHNGLMNYLQWSTDFYRVSDGDGSVVHSSIGFDLTVTSLFPALLKGRPLFLVPDEGAVEELAEILKRSRNQSLLKLTPTHLDVLRHLLADEEVAGHVRAFVIGGEALKGEQLRYWREQAPATRLINEYGPTETVVGCCIYEVKKTEELDGNVPIGRPIANTQLYVLDEWGELVGVGMKGELYIGGAGVARGYLQRPELTAERFIPDAFSSEAGARLYRTGDQARYRADGELEYLGRIDNQVKIRGYRIELGEIEAALSAVSGVREVVVDVRPGLGGTEKRLVAYVVWEAGAEGPVTELRRRLKERLPDYMSPSAYVELAQLPLTANGKVDRRALPEPEAEGGNSSSVQREAGRTPVEELLCGIWAEVLGVEQFGLDDNFFDLGGHSLLATGVASRIRERFGIEFQMRSLFESPTISALAVLVETNLIGHASMDEIAAALERLDQLSNDDIKTLLLNEDRLTADLDTS
jgi:amino acid adenylation domain-containing protein